MWRGMLSGFCTMQIPVEIKFEFLFWLYHTLSNCGESVVSQCTQKTSTCEIKVALSNLDKIQLLTLLHIYDFTKVTSCSPEQPANANNSPENSDQVFIFSSAFRLLVPRLCTSSPPQASNVPCPALHTEEMNVCLQV